MQSQPRPTGEPPDIIYQLHSILEPVNLARLFPKQQALEIELGSGDGWFLAAYAALHPEHNFIGIERLLGRIRKLERKARRAGLTNLRGIRIESAYFLRHLLPQHSARTIHLYFPDPWPKRKHRRHRLVNEAFPSLASQALEPHGAVYLRTDDLDYFGQMKAVFAASPIFEPIETPPALAQLPTDFERDFQARGVATHCVAYRLRQPAEQG